MPLAVLQVLLRRRRRRPTSFETRPSSLAFLFGSFKPRHRYWAMVVLLRKTCVVAVCSVLQQPWQQLYAALWLMTASLLSHLWLQPYKKPRVQALEGLSLSCVTFILAASLAIPIGFGQSLAVEVLIAAVQFGMLGRLAWLAAARTKLRVPGGLVARLQWSGGKNAQLGGGGQGGGGAAAPRGSDIELPPRESKSTVTMNPAYEEGQGQEQEQEQGAMLGGGGKRMSQTEHGILLHSRETFDAGSFEGQANVGASE
jgi:hypothetical protein